MQSADHQNGGQPSSDMAPNDPYFKQLAFALLREKFERELPPLTDDIDALIAREGGVPLEAFIGELERLEQEP